MEQEKFYGVLNAFLTGAAIGVIIALFGIVVYVIYGAVRNWRTRIQQKRYYEQHKHDPKTTGYLTNEHIYQQEHEPIKMKEGKDGIRWGGNVYQIKVKK